MLIQEIRLTCRHLLRHRGFTCLVTVTLAAGIAAATSVFCLVDTVVLRPLAFKDSGRLVALNVIERIPSAIGSVVHGETSWSDFFDWQTQSKSFESLAAFRSVAQNLEPSGSTARRVNGLIVSPSFLSTLHVNPTAGRDFNSADDRAGGRATILSEELATQLFTSSSSAIGKPVHIGGETFYVVGVIGRSFAFPGMSPIDYITTASGDREGPTPIATQRGYRTLTVIGRMKPDTTISEANAEMGRLQQSLAVRFPDTDGNSSVSVESLSRNITGDVRVPMLILLAAVVCLLFIACANAAGLLLTRISARRSELAIRTALGAGRAAIVRLVILETLTLSLVAGAAGLGVTAIVLTFAPAYLPQNLPRIHDLSLDCRTIVFSIVASVLTGLISGVLPAVRATRSDPASALGDSSRGTIAGRHQHRVQRILVIGETGVGLVLLIGAGLLIQSFTRIMNTDLGFGPHHVLTFRIGVPRKSVSEQQELALYSSLQTRLSAVPGVEYATYGFPEPLTGGQAAITFTISGKESNSKEPPIARISVVASNFFQTLGLRLKRGRFFSPSEDHPDAPPVMVVNESFARAYFPGEDAVGQKITPGLSADDQKPVAHEIVGVVGDVKENRVTEPAAPELYMPYAEAPLGNPPLAVRVHGDPVLYEQSVRAAVTSVAPSYPLYKVISYDESVARVVALQRLQTGLLTAFAAIALLLATIGLYALLAYMVTQRTLELGLRMALGATRGQVLSLVVHQGLSLALIGTCSGLLLSAATTRLISGMLYHTAPLDLTTFTGTALILLATASLASLVPALRASRLQPNDCLRQQ